MEIIRNYVVIAELPQEQQEPFNKWLIGQTRPAIETEGDNKYNCAYRWDYDKWLKWHYVGRIITN